MIAGLPPCAEAAVSNSRSARAIADGFWRIVYVVCRVVMATVILEGQRLMFGMAGYTSRAALLHRPSEQQRRFLERLRDLGPQYNAQDGDDSKSDKTRLPSSRTR